MKTFFVEYEPEITRCIDFSRATKLIFEEKFDCILIDLLLPRRAGDKDVVDVSDEIVSNIQESEFNSATPTIAISMHSKIVEELNREFHEAGINLLHYDLSNQNWQSGLSIFLQKVQVRNSFDFIIVCALEKERSAFQYADCEVGALKELYSIDCQEISIGDLRGLIVKPPRMGLVDAAITTTRCLERFSPKLICMSGICAGFSGEVDVGTIVVSERAWEHQAGKWSTGNVFTLEPYQSNMVELIRVKLDQYAKGAEDFRGMKEEGFIGNPLLDEPIVLSPTVSGSAVIASAEKIAEIGEQHKRLIALDMEVFGLYRAVEISSENPIFFSAKTVVDLADDSKGDEHHIYGATISARFVARAIKMLLE